MRQIKFRGKGTDEGKWIHGDLCAYLFDRAKELITCIHIGKKGYIRNGFYQVDPSTVGQYTGLNDCNGKEIYEGDIIKVDELAMPCEVIWYDKTASFQLRYHIKGGFNIPKDALGLWVQDYKSVITVVGNIHDNPELIHEK